MKSILVLLFIILSNAFTVFGQNGRIEIHSGDSSSHYKLLYMSDINADVVITTLNNKGRKINDFTVEDKKGFSFPIDLSGQPSGVYFIEVFTPLYTLYDTINYKTEIDLLKEYFEGEIHGKKVIITAADSLEGEFRIVINEDNKEIISDQKIKGSEFGMRVFDFNDSEAQSTNVSVYYKGNKINTWSVKKDVDP